MVEDARKYLADAGFVNPSFEDCEAALRIVMWLSGHRYRPSVEMVREVQG